MKDIYISAEEAWDYFNNHAAELEEDMLLMAEDDRTGMSVYMSEDCGDPVFYVYDDDTLIDEDSAINKVGCYEAVKNLFSEYLEDDDDEDIEDESSLLHEEEIDYSESELERTFYSLMTSLVEDFLDCEEYSEILDDVKEHTLEYIARKHKLKIRRPMWLEDEKGVFYSEYPYEQMVFSDNNPIYKK